MKPKLHDEVGKNIRSLLKSSVGFNLIICGPNGSGRSTIVNEAITGCNMITTIYDPITYDNAKTYDGLIHLNNNAIVGKFNTRSATKERVLVVDNIDTLTLTNEKKILCDILERNKKVGKVKIICISSNTTTKFMQDIAKLCSVLEIKRLTTKEMNDIILAETKKHELVIEKSVLASINTDCDGDLRTLDTILVGLSSTFGTIAITAEDYTKYKEFRRTKIIDLSCIECVRNMLEHPYDDDNIETRYNSNKVIIPLVLHENYSRDIIVRQRWKGLTGVELLDEISEMFSLSDVVETNIYSQQNWYLQNMHMFMSIRLPLSMMNYRNDTAAAATASSNSDVKSVNEKTIDYDLEFSSELNKTSLKNINRKNITNILQMKSSLSRSDMFHMSYILNSQIQTGDTKSISDHVLAYYKSDLQTNGFKLIDTLLKIDKTQSSISTISTKDKKNILACLVNC
jgi:hypothetical protein